MTALQKIILGTPPAAVDGDPVRTASTKINANVDVLNAQAIMSSFPATLTAQQALTAANHLGKRVNISLAAAGQINLPTCSSCGADGVILLRNVGAITVTVGVTAGSGDGLNGNSALAPGESTLVDTDGVHTWNIAMRGRSSSGNEAVQGNLSVGGNETVNGTLAVGGQATFNVRPQFAGFTALDTGNTKVGKTLISTTNIASGTGFCVLAVPGGYYDYEVEFDGINVATDAVSLVLRLAPDTSSWVAGTQNSFQYTFVGSPAPGISTSTGVGNTSGVTLFTGLSNTAPYSTGGTVKIRNATDSSRFKHVQWAMSSMTSGGNFYTVQGAGVVLGAFVLGGILLIPSAGNFLSGRVSLYGINS
jgi:hypothetical protein